MIGSAGVRATFVCNVELESREEVVTVPEKIKGKTPENTQLNFEQLAQLFPSCVIETTGAGAVSTDTHPNEDEVRHTINWQALADLVGMPLDDALSSDNRREPFGFSWTGKKKAIRESMGAILMM